MSSEIQYSVSYRVANGNYATQFVQSGSIDQAAQGASAGVLSVPTTGVDLPVGNVTTNGVIWLQNLNATNYVQFGVVVSATFYPVGRLKPAEIAVFRLDSGCTLRCVAHTATCLLAFTLLQD